MFDIPILLIVFNRPDTTKLVLENIRKVQPKELFVACDGPRKNKFNEEEKVNSVRNFILNNIDWDCKLYTLFQVDNLGCKKGVSTAINWFFKNIEEGIILEDDCIANISFFNYCKVLLEKYRNDSQIMHISGNNFQRGKIWGDGSYYFSFNPHIWGWASWRRAWKYFDIEMKTFPDFVKQKQINNIFRNEKIRKYWIKYLDSIYLGKKDTWDAQWNFAIWSQFGLCINPNYNLVQNIGFREDATHTIYKSNPLANMKMEELNKIIHPTFKIPQIKADEFSFNFSTKQTLFMKLKQKIFR